MFIAFKNYKIVQKNIQKLPYPIRKSFYQSIYEKRKKLNQFEFLLLYALIKPFHAIDAYNALMSRILESGVDVQPLYNQAFSLTTTALLATEILSYLIIACTTAAPLGMSIASFAPFATWAIYPAICLGISAEISAIFIANIAIKNFMSQATFTKALIPASYCITVGLAGFSLSLKTSNEMRLSSNQQMVDIKNDWKKDYEDWRNDKKDIEKSLLESLNSLERARIHFLAQKWRGNESDPETCEKLPRQCVESQSPKVIAAKSKFKAAEVVVDELKKRIEEKNAAKPQKPHTRQQPGEESANLGIAYIWTLLVFSKILRIVLGGTP